MDTLNDLFQEVFDSNRWNYYEGDFDNPFVDGDYDGFARKYVNFSSKGDSNPLLDSLTRVTSKEHVVSVFFMGLLLYYKCKKIRDTIDRKLNYYKKQNPGIDLSFEFYWFLISLFHDSGYIFEEDNKYDSVIDFKNEFDIKYNLKKYCGVPVNIAKTWQFYYNYKKRYCLDPNCRKPDHGILAGLMLYDYLNKTFEYIKTIGADNGQGVYIYNRLNWSKKLLNIYNLCSWTILAHNIFYCHSIKDSPVKNALYKDKKISELIISEPIIILGKHPLLFLLCLVDTIDPSKKSVNFNAYKMDLLEKQFVISFDGLHRDNAIKELSNWLKIDHAYNPLKNEVTLTFI